VVSAAVVEIVAAEPQPEPEQAASVAAVIEEVAAVHEPVTEPEPAPEPEQGALPEVIGGTAVSAPELAAEYPVLGAVPGAEPVLTLDPEPVLQPPPEPVIQAARIEAAPIKAAASESQVEEKSALAAASTIEWTAASEPSLKEADAPEGAAAELEAAPQPAKRKGNIFTRWFRNRVRGGTV
jgi:hypothetical protein